MSARNIPLAVIACGVPVARHTSLALGRMKLEKEPGTDSVPMPTRSGVNRWLASAIVLFLTIYVGIFSPRLSAGMPVPSGAVTFMKQHKLHGNVLNDYEWGGYLIWHIGPESKDFIDGRGETVFSDKVLNDYITFYFDRPGSREVLRTYDHDFVLIPPDAPACNLLEHDADWKMIYRDKTAVLFVRATSPMANLPGAPVEGAAGGNGLFPG